GVPLAPASGMSTPQKKKTPNCKLNASHYCPPEPGNALGTPANRHLKHAPMDKPSTRCTVRAHPRDGNQRRAFFTPERGEQRHMGVLAGIATQVMDAVSTQIGTYFKLPSDLAAGACLRARYRSQQQ